MPKKKYKTSIVGAGKVGSVIAALLHEKGFPIVSVVDINLRAATQLARKVKCKQVSDSFSGIHKNTDLLFITTPDDVIATAAEGIAAESRLKFKNLTAIHTSGVHTSAVLLSLKKKGSTTLSFHPVQSFPKDISLTELKKSIKGIYFGVEGNEKSRILASHLVSLLGGKTIFLDKKDKPLYHLACVFASNYIVTILDVVSVISGKLKLKQSWAKVFLPLIITALENALTTTPRQALTGPIERGDFETVKTHIKELKKYIPQTTGLYSALAIETAKLAFSKGSITREQFKEINKLLEKT
ncbi:MAG: DUF2520 domain-containing protein [Bacteroidetes bacterium]|nr:DUF2520 domain-containing protein [Bacteroidota bacterium]MBU1423859.1 DUF2520 domain-containing protein [Bacteroidota bacterium]MBU2471237.1 DUF2520 domain-containing protein [Bacteroidota bacterium]